MPPEDRIRIEHMIDAAGSVARFIAGRLKNDIETDEMLRFALVRAIEIFGEAAGKVSAETRSAHSNIPWQPIIGMRNRLVHAYFDIDADILWVAAIQEVPALLPKLQVMTSED